MANEFLTFAGDIVANVLPQAEYAGSSFLPTRTLGFQTGVAKSAELNKVWRQSSLMTSMLGAFIDAHGMNALDDGSTGGMTNLLNNFTNSLTATIHTVFPDAPSDGATYGRRNQLWVASVPEAPITGVTFARNNGAWVSIATSSGIPDAPSDGNIYGRLNASWTIVSGGGGGITQAQADLRYLQLIGGTLTGTLLLSKAAATQRSVVAETGTSWRWELRIANADPESTGNLGSNFQITRYSDGGSLLDSPITISRQTGILDFAHPPTILGQPIPGLTTNPPISITTPGTTTFNDPGYGTIIIVDCYGGGGSGGPGSNVMGGSGGGGGAHTHGIFRRADLIFPITLTVAAGGAAVAGIAMTSSTGPPPPDGLNGGTTSFGTYLLAYGGGGGGRASYWGGGSLQAGLPGGGGGGAMGPGNIFGGPGYGGEPLGYTYTGTFPHLAQTGSGGAGSITPTEGGDVGGAGSAEWGGGGGAPCDNKGAAPGDLTHPGYPGGASMWGGAGGGGGGGYHQVSGGTFTADAGGPGGQINAYTTFSPGITTGPAGGAGNTNAGIGTPLHGNMTFGGQGGPGGASRVVPGGSPGTIATGFSGGRGGDCGGGGGGGGVGYNVSDTHGTGGTSGAGGNGAIFITIL